MAVVRPDEEAAQSRSPSTRTVPAVAAVVTAAALLWHLTTPSLWADEFATEGAARLSWGQLWQLLRHIDMTIGPYYACMHVWTDVFGTSELSLRTPSVIAMTLTAALTADSARRLFGPRSALVAAALFVITPATSRYGQEARPYALGCFFVALAMWALLSRTSERSRQFLAAVAVMMAGLMQPAFLMAVPGLALLGAQELRRAARWRWLLTLTVAAVPGVWIYAYSAQGDTSIWAWVQLITWASLAWRMTSVVGPSQAGGAVLLTLAACALTTTNLRRSLGLIGLAPIALLLLVGTHERVFIARLLLFTLPAIVLLATAALRRATRLGAVTVLLLFAALNLSSHVDIRQPAGHGQDGRLVASVIGTMSRPGDVAVYGPLPRSINWSPRDMVTYYVPRDRTPKDVLALAPQRTNGNFMAPEAADFSKLLAPASRIWIIRADRPLDPRTGLGAKSTWLVQRTQIVHQWHGAEATIALVERAAGHG